MGMLVEPSRGLKAILVPLRVFGLTRATAGAFVLPLKVLSRKKLFEEIMCCFRIGSS